MKTTVTFYENAFDTKGKDAALDEIYKDIQNGRWANEIKTLRTTEDDELKDALKKQLPCFTAAGQFIVRNDNGLFSHSNRIIIDFDSLSEPAETKTILAADKYVEAVFVSSSAKGLAVAVKIDGKHHEEAYKVLSSYFFNKYQLFSDPSGKNISRIRFISHDPEIYINHDSIAYEFTPEEKKATTAPKRNAVPDEGVETVKVKYLWCKRHRDSQDKFHRGNRNNYIMNLAYFLNKAGVPLDYSVQNLIHEFTQPDFPAKEIYKVVKSAYEDRPDEFNTYPIQTELPLPPVGYQKETLSQLYAELAAQIKSKHSLSEDKKTKLAQRFKVDSSFVDEVYKFLMVQKAAVGKTENPYKDMPVPRIVKVEQFLNEHYEFRKNEVNLRVDYRKIGETNFVKVNVNEIHRQLQHANLGINLQDVRSLLKSEFVESYDPFLEYFESLPKWDGYTDHIGKLASYVKTDDQDFFVSMFRKMLMRSIGCSLGEIVNRFVFVLVGEKQNTGKSTFIRNLNPFGKEYYTEAPLRADKDTQLRFANNFMVNLEELQSLSYTDINALKAIISASNIKERRPYEAEEEEQIRRCNFYGTTNRAEFLTDSENTRWLPFNVLSIDFKGYSNNIDIKDVWAQAYALYMSGANFELTAEEAEKRDKRNFSYMINNIEMDVISQQFLPGEEGKSDSIFVPCNLILSVVKLATGEFAKVSDYNVWKALKILQFPADRKYVRGFSNHQVRGYYFKKSDKLQALLNIADEGFTLREFVRTPSDVAYALANNRKEAEGLLHKTVSPLPELLDEFNIKLPHGFGNDKALEPPISEDKPADSENKPPSDTGNNSWLYDGL